MTASTSQWLKFRPRLSVRSLFLFITVLTFTATIWKLSLDLRVARDELNMLRQKGGHLEISDLNTIHAVKLPSEHRLQWNYRVYVPDHLEVEVYSYGWNFTSGFARNNKFPKILGPGEHLLTYTLHANSFGNSEIDYVIRSPTRTTKSEIVTQFDHNWATKRRSCTYIIAPDDFTTQVEWTRWIQYHTLQLDDSRPFALMRFGPKDKIEDEGRGPGVMVWLNPRKKVKP